VSPAAGQQGGADARAHDEAGFEADGSRCASSSVVQPRSGGLLPSPYGQRRDGRRQAKSLPCRLYAEACVERVLSAEPGCPFSAGGACHHRVSRAVRERVPHDLSWLDLAEGRLCLARLAATAAVNFLPLAQAPFLARQESRLPPSSAALRA